MELTQGKSNAEHQNQISPLSEESKQSAKILLICTGILSGLAILVLIILLPIYFSGDEEIATTQFTTMTSPVTSLELTSMTNVSMEPTPSTEITSTLYSPPMASQPPNERVDCLPDETPTQVLCEDRGCVWSHTDDSSSAAPQCYFAGSTLYALQDSNSSSNQIVSTLILTNSGSLNHFGPNFPVITAITTFASATTLRVKISPNSQRYEVPLIHPPSVAKPKTSLYSVHHSNENERFGVVISRRSSSTAIFDTSFGELMFSDQFAQISTRVPTNYVYGFGEHFHTTWKRDMNWNTYGMFARKPAYQRSKNLNGVHPFFLCMEENGDAYGILFLNSNAMDVALQPTPAITYRTTGGILDFYIFLGPTPDQVISQYFEIIGKPAMPPYWSLGFHLSRRGYVSLSNLTAVVERNIATGLPYDVQHVDIDYMDRGVAFTIDDEHFNGLGEYLKDLKAKEGIRNVVVLNPTVSGNETDGPYQPYEKGMEFQVFIKGVQQEIAWGKSWSLLPGANSNPTAADNTQRAHVAFPDFFHPNASLWWSQICEDFHQDLEFDGLSLDMNEPTSFVNGSVTGCDESNSKNHPPYRPAVEGEKLSDATLCMSNTQYRQIGGSYTEHYNMHNLYGLTQSLISQEACTKSTGERCFMLSSSTYPGSGKYAGHSISETQSTWEHLAASIIGVLELNMFGIPFVGSDVCGYHGDASYELCVRWMQLGAFHPFFRNHNSERSQEQDPAYFGNTFVSDVREAMEARYTLLPYLYTLFFESHLHGSAIVRPLMFQFPNDNKTYELKQQFMWGNAVLVSPVVKPGATTVTAYFPKSRWFNFYSGAEIPSYGSEIELLAPINRINLHFRGGSIIPTQEPAQTTLDSRQNKFGIVVALNDVGESLGKLFWDDGYSVNTISDRKYTEVEFSNEKQFLRSKVKQSHESGGNMTLNKIHILGIEGSVTRVKIDGVDVEYLFLQNTKRLLIENLSLDMRTEFELTWEIDNEWTRIDCMPSMTERPNRVACLQRGCTWQPALQTNVPNCFFTLDASGVFTSPFYSGSAVELDAGYSRYNLTLDGESRLVYGSPFLRLTAEVEYQTENRLHIKIRDDEQSSYEIPEEILNLSSSKLSSTDNCSYSVEVNQSPFYIKVFRKKTGKLIFDSSIAPIVFENRFLQIATILPSENVFGFGEHNHKRYRHDLNWRRWGMFTRDWLPVGPFNLYGHQTFFMSIDDSENGTAMGVYFHNSNAMDVTLQPRPSVTYRSTGGVIDLYIFLSDSQEGLTQEYQRLVGLPMIPPYWGLGFQLSRWGYGSLDRVKAVVSEMREAEIPFDVQYGDIDYMDNSKDFTYDQVNYDGLPEFTDQLHEWGIRYVIILDPAIKIEDDYEPYERGMRDGVFVMNDNGATPAVSRVWPGLTHHVDYTHPNTTQWWSDECTAFYNETGIRYDALWVDMNEPSSFLNVSPFDILGTNCSREFNKPPFMPKILWFRTGLHSRTLCMENRQFMGRHYDLHSLYGHAMSSVTHETLKHIFPNKRSFVITRSTFAGSGHHAGHWLGDNQSAWPPMEWSITGMLEFNLFGIPYVGADICGFMLDATSELCTRWMQIGAFYPFSRNHNANGKQPQHPTYFGPNSTASSKKVLEVRYSILPYFYTLHYNVHKNGGTVIRSLVHEFANDRNTWNTHKQVLVGGGFLVTPVLENGARRVTGYFPAESRWFDFYTGVELTTAGYHTPLDAALDHINLHVRGGYIIPMQDPAVTTVISRQKPMHILVPLDDEANASGTLYWDDGEMRNVGDKYLEIHFNCTESTMYFNIAHTPVDFNTNLFFNKVTILGLEAKAITSVLTYENSTAANPGMEKETDYTFTSDNILTIRNITLRIDSPHVIRWIMTDP